MSKEKPAISNDYQNFKTKFPKGTGKVKPSVDYQNWKLGIIFKHVPEETEKAETKDETAKDQEKDNTTKKRISSESGFAVANQQSGGEGPASQSLDGLSSNPEGADQEQSAASEMQEASNQSTEPPAEVDQTNTSSAEKNITDPEETVQAGDTNVSAAPPGTQEYREQNDFVRPSLEQIKETIDAYYEAESSYMNAKRLARQSGNDQLKQIAGQKRKAMGEAIADLKEIGIIGANRDGNRVTLTFEDGSQNKYEYQQ